MMDNLPVDGERLVHEMDNHQQHFFGHPGRNRYHNAEWGRMMDEVVLTPSNTGFDIPFADIWADKKRKTGDRAKYTCPHCGTNAWAKPDTNLICMNCLTAQFGEEEHGGWEGFATRECRKQALGEGDPI